MEKILSSFFC